MKRAYFKVWVKAWGGVSLAAFIGIAPILSWVGTGCVWRQPAHSPVRTLNVSIWSHYLPIELVEEFHRKTGINVRISNYSSNEELLAKLQAGASGYDLVVPSDYMVEVMIHLNLLKKLDLSQLPNTQWIDKKFQNQFYDPKNQYSIPYDWGTTGIAINRSLFQGKLRGWKDLFENPELHQKLSLLDDAREVIGAALKKNGASLNSTRPEDLKEAQAVLIKVRGHVKQFTSEPLMPLVRGEVAVAQIFVSDALHAQNLTQGKVEYLIPEEGSTRWIDNLVIPAGSQNVAEAYEFINFLMEPASNAATVQSVFVSPTNLGVLALLPRSLATHSALFPSEILLKKTEMIHDLGPALTEWDRIWTELKATRD